MADTKTAAHASTDKNHPSKKAIDKYGGDPLAPNDAVLERIAKVVKGGKADELVDRWSDALKSLFTDENPPNTQKRILLHKIARYVRDEKVDDVTEKEVEDWADGGEKAKQAKKSDHNLDHLQ